MPSGVSPSATCTLLLGPNGKTVYGETWVVRTSGNLLKVKTFPNTPPDGTDSVTLCLSSAAPYGIKHQCNATDPDNVFTGNATSISVNLGKLGITAADPVYFSLSVLQASTMANSNGSGGATPSPSPSPSTSPSHTKSPSPSVSPTHTTASPSVSPTHTTASPSVSPTHTTASPSVSPTHTSKSPSASVSATKTHRVDSPTPATSVLAVKLAHTGADGTLGTLGLSAGLLALGGILVAVGGLLAVLHGSRWPAMGGRYERSTRPRALRPRGPGRRLARTRWRR